VVALHFVGRTHEQHRRLIELMFSAPDSWKLAHGLEMTSPQHLRRIIGSLRQVYSRRRTLRRLAPRFPCHFAVSVGGAHDGRELVGYVTDMSYTGMRIRMSERPNWAEGDDVQLLVAWNEYERSTLRGRITNISAQGGDASLGILLSGLNRQQEADLIKHLYPRAAEAPVRKAAA
jgi:hypothetical protein